MICTRCGGTGFLNNEQGPVNEMTSEGVPEMDAYQLREWALDHPETDFKVCDCCGDGESWHDEPGEHYNKDIRGLDGPYAYNGGLAECN